MKVQLSMVITLTMSIQMELEKRRIMELRKMVFEGI